MNSGLYQPTANEPRVLPLIRNSFAFVPTAGMRLAPEILVLELFREIFFKSHSDDEHPGTKEINPDELNENRSFVHGDHLRAVLYSLRGRRKKSKGSRDQRFFAPAYPVLADLGWLGKKRERVINNFLLGGPIAQHLWHRGEGVEEKKREQEEFINVLVKALVGQNSCPDRNTVQDKEILSVTIRQVGFQINTDLARQKLEEKTGRLDSVFRTEFDELAMRIYWDLKRICELEATIPRIQWMQVLMTFLRFALPMWLLGQMKITTFIHRWLVNAVDEQMLAESKQIRKTIATRNLDLLHPILTPTRELFEHIERYMKHRVEVNILLYSLERVRQGELANKKLVLDGGGAGEITVEHLLVVARDAADNIRSDDRFVQVARGLDVRRFLAREGELFAAWRDPLLKGQGKNIDEFLRVMYRAEVGDEEGGYLLAPEGRGLSRGFRVFPGQLLLKTITQLAVMDKRASNGGKLVLEDVERHFRQYGIDFTHAADARPLLMRELQDMGLLAGSPDAGSSVAVRSPY